MALSLDKPQSSMYTLNSQFIDHYIYFEIHTVQDYLPSFSNSLPSRKIPAIPMQMVCFCATIIVIATNDVGGSAYEHNISQGLYRQNPD